MPNGCGKCWEEFKGWLRAFTPLETLLTILEAILLVLLLVFMVFLILHFNSCSVQNESGTNLYPGPNYTHPPILPNATSTTKKVTRKTTRPTCTYTPVTVSANESVSSTEPTTVTFDDTASVTFNDTTSVTFNDTTTVTKVFNNVSLPSMTDGELVDDDERRVVMALVKIKPSGLTFGCILTVVSERWMVTAASCLDSIEEVDSLDNFVIIDNYDEANKGRSHAVTDVRVHPMFEGRNKSYDLALLRSDDDLGRTPVRLPTLLDYFRLTVGEAVKILGFGPFRTIDSLNKRVHSAIIHVLPLKHCTPPDSVERHLVPLSPVVHGRCGVSPVCGGVLYARGTPCNYCAGSPMIRGNVLLGVMADHEQCGAACEPALHVNIAAARDWVEQMTAD